MAKIYNGTVSIVRNTKGEIALKKDPEGKFSTANAKECYETLVKLAKSHKAAISTYSLFMTEGGTEPVLLANSLGNPFIALLAKRKTGKTGSKVVKLA